MLYGERIKQAREIQGLTQKQLADLAGVAQSTIAQLESERFRPSQDVIEAISQATAVRPAFYARVPVQPFPMGSLVYRARASASTRVRNQAYQLVKLLVEQMQGMAEFLSLPPLTLPKVDDPTQAAHLTREAFGLERHRPVPHLINVLERHGIIAFAMPYKMDKIDAFSTWAEIDGERPLVTLSSGCSGDRIRSSTAHELGHLVMHRGLKYDVPNLEDEANKFAAEFLLPEQSMRRVFRQNLTLDYAQRLKPIWKVSMQMLIRRAKDLGCITERRYRYLFMQIGRRGWRKAEPVDISTEQPRLYRQMAEMIYGTENKSQLGVESGISSAYSNKLFAEYDPPILTQKFLDTEPYFSGIRNNKN